MNERILGFAKEAGHIYHVGGTVPYFEFSDNQMKKFAELIVRECSDYVHKCITEDGNEYPNKSVAYRIKQHFGVEE